MPVKISGLPAATTLAGTEQLPVVQSGVTVRTTATAVAATFAPSLQAQTYVYFTTSGSSTAYTLTPTPVLTALATGQRFRVVFHTAAGATPTLAISGLTAKNLKYKDSVGTKQAVTSTQIPSSWVSDVEYDGTDMVVLLIPPTTAPFSDASALVKNSADATKLLIFSAASITTATTRTLTAPDKNGTIATTLDIPFLPTYKSGLILSTAGASATMSISAGAAADSTNVAVMTLSAFTKTTSAWAVGSGNGGMDTSTVANSTWYAWWLIQRTDTSVVDVLFSLSGTAPTMPTNYTLKRRIGWGKTNGSAQWTLFFQYNDEFWWDIPVSDVAISGPGTAAVTRTLTVPPWKVQAIFDSVDQSSSTAHYTLFTDLSQTDTVPSSTLFSFGQTSAAANQCATGEFRIVTNTSSQIRSRASASGAGDTLNIATKGWKDYQLALGT